MKAVTRNQLQTSVLPCPFCAGKAKLEPMVRTNSWWRVRCGDYECGGTTWARLGPDVAVNAWNRRFNVPQ